MPYNIHWTGERIHGTFNLETLTFMPNGDTDSGIETQSVATPQKTVKASDKA